MATTVRALDLEIGDIVQMGDGPYMCCTVCNVDEKNVHLVRPYIQTADFTCTGGVITYIGQERYSICRNADAVMLLESRDPEETRKKIRAIVEDIRHCVTTGQTAAALEKLRSL